MNKCSFWLVLFIAAALTVNVFAQQNKPKNSDTIVISTIQDIDSTANVFYTLRSDAGGNYVNGTASVASAIQGIGDWDLDMLNSATRRVFFDFGSPTGTNPDNITAPASGAYPALFWRNVQRDQVQNCRI